MSKSVFEVKEDFTGIEKLLKSLKTKKFVKVGVLRGNVSRQRKEGEKRGPNNATIGLKHEFGSFSEGIPKRSFIRMPIQHRQDKIIESVLENKEKYEEALADNEEEVLFQDLGFLAEEAIQESFETQGFGQWRPNSPATIELKGSDSPLIDTAQLRKSITSKVVDG